MCRTDFRLGHAQSTLLLFEHTAWPTEPLCRWYFMYIIAALVHSHVTAITEENDVGFDGVAIATDSTEGFILLATNSKHVIQFLKR